MKNKYQRMTKEEKKDLKVKYYQTPKGKEMKNRLDHLIIIALAGLIFSVFLIVSALFSQELTWKTWVLAIVLDAFSIVYLVSSIYLRRKVLNQFAIKQK